jgi:hypothetical protein
MTSSTEFGTDMQVLAFIIAFSTYLQLLIPVLGYIQCNVGKASAEDWRHAASLEVDGQGLALP